MSAATYSIPSFFGRVREGLAALARHLVVVERCEADPASLENPWQPFWGATYGPELKQWLLKLIFEELESSNKIGDLVVDVGSGASPVTDLLPATAGRKRVLVDIAADNTRSGSAQKIRLNAEKAAEPTALSYGKAMLRISRFLDIDPKSPALSAHADTIVFSDLLNYVDYRKVLRAFAGFLKPDGRIVIVNLPIRGNQSLFSGKGLKDNRDLYAVLENLDFDIEHKSFPKRPRNETDESQELIILVAQKRRDTYRAQHTESRDEELKLTFTES